MIKFKPWRKFHARFDKDRVQSFVEEAADEAESVFIQGMAGRHTGRVRRKKRGGGQHQASRAGEYPATDTGELEQSIKTRVRRMAFRIGTSAPYAIYLRTGTSRMKRRKMSDNALQTSVSRTRRRLRGFAKFKRD